MGVRIFSYLEVFFQLQLALELCNPRLIRPAQIACVHCAERTGGFRGETVLLQPEAVSVCSGVFSAMSYGLGASKIWVVEAKAVEDGDRQNSQF